jgi:hypothetical protein
MRSVQTEDWRASSAPARFVPAELAPHAVRPGAQHLVKADQ